MPLARALALLVDGQKASALDALLDEWRERRSPEIADVIDVLSEDLTRTLPPIDGKTRRAFQEAWLDVAGEGRSSDVGRLLATFAREPCTQIPERLARFEARGADPRVARELWAMIGRCPCTSNPNFPLWTRIFKVLSELRDVRMRAPLEAKLAAKRELGSFYDVLYPRIEKTLAALVEPEPLALEDAAVMKELAVKARALLEAPSTAVTEGAPKRRGEKSEEELLARVYEDPESDAPRLVYGDWLLERGDPRGELITLQFKRLKEGLTKGEAQREKALLREHGRRWLGAIEPVIGREDVRFERGFVTSCTAAFRTKRQRATLLDHPAWSTVRELHEGPVELCAHPVMRSLRVVTGIAQGVAAQLADHGSMLPIEELHVAIDDAGATRELASVGSARALPRLRRLTLHLPSIERGPPPALRPIDLAWLLTGRLGQQLEHLALVGRVVYGSFEEPRPDLGPWLVEAARLERLTSMSFDVQFNWKVTVKREGGAWALELQAFSPEQLGTLIPVLLGVPPKTFVRVALPPEARRNVTDLLAKYTA